MSCSWHKLDLDLLECLQKWKGSTAWKLKVELHNREVREAERDPHSRRKPIPCGLTIHPAYGCSYDCSYCYIYSMGLPMNPKPNPLSPKQLLLALSINPYFIPGPYGTLLAFGSITEPFINPHISMKTISYMKIIDRFYGNPIQVSTKSILIEDYAGELKSLMQDVSILYSISALKNYRYLEPRAPPPEKRLECMGKLIERGLRVYLFLRPLIPGVSEKEIAPLIERASRLGVSGVIPGSLRVNRDILVRLKKRGVDVNPILFRVRGNMGEKQVAVDTGYLKRMVYAEASRLGVRVFPSSCAANIHSHNQACWKCRMGPCGPEDSLIRVEPEDIKEILQHYGFRRVHVSLEYGRLKITAESMPRNGGRRILYWLRELARRPMDLRLAEAGS